MLSIGNLPEGAFVRCILWGCIAVVDVPGWGIMYYAREREHAKK